MNLQIGIAIEAIRRSMKLARMKDETYRPSSSTHMWKHYIMNVSGLM